MTHDNDQAERCAQGWDGTENRRTPPHTLAEAIEILDRRIDDRIKIHLERHNAQEIMRQQSLVGELRTSIEGLEDLIKRGFPGGDPEEHRRYHEEAIALMRARRKLMESISERTVTGLVWAVIGVTGLALWHFLVARIVGTA